MWSPINDSRQEKGEQTGIPSIEGFQCKSIHPLIDSNIADPFRPKRGWKYKLDVSTLSSKWQAKICWPYKIMHEQPFVHAIMSKIVQIITLLLCLFCMGTVRGLLSSGMLLLCLLQKQSYSSMQVYLAQCVLACVQSTRRILGSPRSWALFGWSPNFQKKLSFLVIPHAFFFSNAWPNARAIKTLENQNIGQTRLIWEQNNQVWLTQCTLMENLCGPDR